MTNSKKNMFWTYTILAGVCGIGVVIFGFLAKYSEKIEPKKESTNPVINVKGDYVNGDKTIEKHSTSPKVKIIEKPQVIKQEIHGNNGIIMNGDNYGNQEVHNSPIPRELNNKDIEVIKSSIPKDFSITVDYCFKTTECKNYAESIISILNRLGYPEVQRDVFGDRMDMNYPQGKDERFLIIEFNNDNKTAIILVRQQI